MSRAPILYGAVALQLAALAYLVVREERTLRGGARVVLEVQGYDPNSLLSGRYIATPLRISRLDLAQVAHPENVPTYGPVFVRLEPGEPFWTATRVATAIPADDASSVYIAGTLTSQSGSMLTIDYGRDRYFIPETAMDPTIWWTESRPNRRQLALVVRVGRSGKSSTEDLLVDGKPFADWNREESARAR